MGNIVVGGENDLQIILGHRIIVDDSGSVIDQVNDLLGHHITRCCLTAEDLDARRPFLVRIFLDLVPQGDGLEQVHQLAFVFMDTLDLDIQDGVRADVDLVFLIEPGEETLLVRLFCCTEFLLETLVFSKGHQLFKALEIIRPVRTDGFVDQIAQRFVAVIQPAARCNAVGLVDNPARIDLVQIPEDRFFDKLGMQR